MKSRLLFLAFPVLTACAGWTDDVAGPSPGTLPPNASLTQGALVDRYIVVFRDDVQDPVTLTNSLARAAGATVHYTYTHALKGFAATIPAAAVEGISRNPNVSYIEADGIATITGTQSPTPSWGLDRIDQRNLPLDNSYTYNFDGTGVTAYILDTGIRRTHNDFGGRASATGYDAIGDGQNGNDCHGHGTHVAGTVGGSTYGVAKNVTLVTVRVLNCSGSGSYSGIIAGVNWVAGRTGDIAVANMSLGGSLNSSLNQAVTNAVASGVTFAVAAGNSNANACNYSPAATPSALTVGSTTSSDARSSFSNYGTCVDLFAPGSSITSAWNSSNTATNTISGTSMASPHVAGVAALVLDQNSGFSPSQVESWIESRATANTVTNPGTGSPNLLLYSLDNPPTSAIQLSATGYKVKGIQRADLSWTGAAGNVNILRDGTIVGNTGGSSFTDNINRRGGGSYNYQVCETTGSLRCSNVVNVSF